MSSGTSGDVFRDTRPCRRHIWPSNCLRRCAGRLFPGHSLPKKGPWHRDLRLWPLLFLFGAMSLLLNRSPPLSVRPSGKKFFDVINVYCSSSWLAFLKLAYLINLMHHFKRHWAIWFGSYLFVHPTFFKKITWFLGFSVCSSFGRQLCQNCGSAESEPYVQLHITDPACLRLKFMSDLLWRKIQ